MSDTPQRPVNRTSGGVTSGAWVTAGVVIAVSLLSTFTLSKPNTTTTVDGGSGAQQVTADGSDGVAVGAEDPGAVDILDDGAIDGGSTGGGTSTARRAGATASGGSTALGTSSGGGTATGGATGTKVG